MDVDSFQYLKKNAKRRQMCKNAHKVFMKVQLIPMIFSTKKDLKTKVHIYIYIYIYIHIYILAYDINEKILKVQDFFCYFYLNYV